MGERPYAEVRHVQIAHAGGARTDGDLTVPDYPSGIVVFAHGSGSSRHSPRNRMVAHGLQDQGFATLLLDLLTVEEEAAERRGGMLRFDVELLAHRLVGAVRALRTDIDLANLPIGYFGASTGAAAVLIAAATEPDHIAAVVSRGGRPDLAGSHLAHVRAPTLLIVGGADVQVIELNRQALAQLTAPADLVLVPGATHLFEEPGALEQVAEIAGRWFTTHLASSGATRRTH